MTWLFASRSCSVCANFVWSYFKSEPEAASVFYSV